MPITKITTIKLGKNTKTRLDKLRSYPKEPYDSILNKMLNVLNLCKISPERAKYKLGLIDRRNTLNKRIEAKETA